jgi:hypothetical protein
VRTEWRSAGCGKADDLSTRLVSRAEARFVRNNSPRARRRGGCRGKLPYGAPAPLKRVGRGGHHACLRGLRLRLCQNASEKYAISAPPRRASMSVSSKPTDGELPDALADEAMTSTGSSTSLRPPPVDVPERTRRWGPTTACAGILTSNLTLPAASLTKVPRVTAEECNDATTFVAGAKAAPSGRAWTCPLNAQKCGSWTATRASCGQPRECCPRRRDRRRITRSVWYGDRRRRSNSRPLCWQGSVLKLNLYSRGSKMACRGRILTPNSHGDQH